MSFRQLFDRYVALAESGERMRLALENPVLLSRASVQAMHGELQHEKAQGRAVDREMERLVEVDALRGWLAEDARRYPAGLGPVEKMAARVAAGEITPEAAAQALAAPEKARHLVPIYAHLLIFHAEQRALGGDIDTALGWARLLARACEANWPAGAVNETLHDAAVGFIQIAGVALGMRPDGDLLWQAEQLGARLLARLTGEDDVERRAAVHHALGVLHSDPVSSSTGGGAKPLAAQLWNQAVKAQHGELAALVRHGGHPLPDRTEMLEQALKDFEQALPGRQGAGRGLTLKAMAQTMVFLAQAREQPVDADRVEALCREALALLPAGGYQHDATRAVLQQIGRAAPPAAAPASAPTTPDQVLLQAGLRARDDPAAAYEMLAAADEIFARQATETQRRGRWATMTTLLPRAFDGADLARFPGPPTDAAGAIVKAAQDEHWSPDRLAATLFDRASVASREDGEEDGLRLLQAATQLSPRLAAQHAPVAMLYAQLCTGAAVNALNAGQPGTALKLYAQALGPYLRLPLPSLAVEMLERIADVAGRPAPDVAEQALFALAPLAFEVERTLKEPGVQLLREAFARAIFGMGETVNAYVLGMLVQLSKGARFDAVLRGGSAFDWRRDEQAVALRAQIDALQARVPAPAADPVLDGWLLLAAVAEVDAAGASDAERLRSLQVAFDRHLREHEAAAVARPSIVNPEVIPHLLDERTVLLDYVVARGDGDARAVVIVAYTRDGVQGFRNPVAQAREVLADAGSARLLIDGLAMRTHRLRDALAEEPPAAEPMSPKARASLDDDFETLLGTPAWRFLKAQRAAGRDHLCIRAQGALRYYPLALLGRDGEDLAASWIVTMLPSLQTLLQPAPARRTGGDRALGLGYADARWAPLPELPNARAEVEAISRLMGTQPLLDDDADEAAVLQALTTARRVHLCAHGLHVPAAPAFHHLVLGRAAGSERDGRLCAHELAGVDLHGLEVLTLGSCDSALGRFDAGDNPSGLPAALLAAGAQTIVAALWELADAPAMRFFTAFHEALHRDASRLDAFAEAQRAVRREFPQARDWAALCYLGDWDRAPPRLPDGVPAHSELA